MDSREKALQELKKRMTEQKARLDPAVLKQAQKAASLSQGGGAPDKGSVPYDREAAGEAVAIFLRKNRHSKDFEQKLIALIAKTRH